MRIPPGISPLRQSATRRCGLINGVWCLLAILGILAPSSGHAQGALSNGGNHDGTILTNQVDSWTFTASAGDRIVLRGAGLIDTNNFKPWLRVYDPGGVLINDSGSGNGNEVVELALTATNTGTYTVLVSDTGFGLLDGTGT